MGTSSGIVLRVQEEGAPCPQAREAIGSPGTIDPFASHRLNSSARRWTRSPDEDFLGVKRPGRKRGRATSQGRSVDRILDLAFHLLDLTLDLLDASFVLEERIVGLTAFVLFMSADRFVDLALCLIDFAGHALLH